MVSSQALAMMRRQANKALVDTAIISRWTVASGPYAEETYAAVGTVSCRLLPRERLDLSGVVAMREQSSSYYKLILPWNADIQDGDRVEIASLEYEVKQLDTLRSDRTDKQAQVVQLG